MRRLKYIKRTVTALFFGLVFFVFPTVSIACVIGIQKSIMVVCEDGRLIMAYLSALESSDGVESCFDQALDSAAYYIRTFEEDRIFTVISTHSDGYDTMVNAVDAYEFLSCAKREETFLDSGVIVTSLYQQPYCFLRLTPRKFCPSSTLAPIVSWKIAYDLSEGRPYYAILFVFAIGFGWAVGIVFGREALRLNGYSFMQNVEMLVAYRYGKLMFRMGLFLISAWLLIAFARSDLFVPDIFKDETVGYFFWPSPEMFYERVVCVSAIVGCLFAQRRLTHGGSVRRDGGETNGG